MAEGGRDLGKEMRQEENDGKRKLERQEIYGNL